MPCACVSRALKTFLAVSPQRNVKLFVGLSLDRYGDRPPTRELRAKQEVVISRSVRIAVELG
jgi:hypothetical protein